MTTYIEAVNDIDDAIAIFRDLNVDEQLAWLWFVYTKTGKSITPAAPGAASSKIAQGLLKQVEKLSDAEQLESMRAIARKDASHIISREYGSLGTDTKLAFWYMLAVGMDQGSIVAMPDSYAISDKGRDLLAAAETFDLETQITLLRKAVEPMGAEPKSGSQI
ncbi:MAG: orange carotenoid protein N-terminal domain-containing protein [Cyanobacteria bacterium P01_C01_bin.120]